MNIRAHVIFKGRVQGVFFRANTFEKARDCGILGWVKNLADGTVEAVFEGDEVKVKEVIEWCRTSLPYAHVDEAIVETGEPTGEFSSFDIIH